MLMFCLYLSLGHRSLIWYKQLLKPAGPIIGKKGYLPAALPNTLIDRADTYTAKFHLVLHSTTSRYLSGEKDIEVFFVT